MDNGKVDYRLKVGYKIRTKKKTYFFEKRCDFRDFSVSFVIFI